MFDAAIIGGGIIGLTTAVEYIRKFPTHSLVVIEKEAQIATHQTGNNSGVIHSGIYYKPNSLKALTCRRGVDKLIQFCKNYDIKYELCGKIIVATTESEIPRLLKLFEYGKQNGVPNLELIDANKIKELEPHATGVKGIYSPTTGIVNYLDICKSCAKIIRQKNGVIKLNTKVNNIFQKSDYCTIITSDGTINSKIIINCAGLFSDRIAKLTEKDLRLRIIPFRGEYFRLKANKSNLVKNLIYPVPNPDFPFLGVHFTRKIDGAVEAGPNAVLAFAREGYRKTNINFRDFLEIFSYPAFWKLGKKYWKTGLSEMLRSYRKELFVKALQKLVPEIESNDLEKGGSGVRAQALLKNGKLLDDFDLVRNKNVFHVLNAPSPAATSSFAIAENIVSQIKAYLNEINKGVKSSRKFG